MTPYLEGRKAYYGGKTMSWNPHKKGSKDWRQWKDGWLSASYEYSEQCRIKDEPED